MRLLVENYGDAQIFKDKSLEGVLRWVVVWLNGDRVQTYSSKWYTLDKVKEYVEKEL